MLGRDELVICLCALILGFMFGLLISAFAAAVFYRR